MNEQSALATDGIKHLDAKRAGHIPAALLVRAEAIAAGFRLEGGRGVEGEFAVRIDGAAQRHEGQAGI